MIKPYGSILRGGQLLRTLTVSEINVLHDVSIKYSGKMTKINKTKKQ